MQSCEVPSNDGSAINGSSRSRALAWLIIGIGTHCATALLPVLLLLMTCFSIPLALGEIPSHVEESISSIDVSGEWEVQEDDRTYQATLDRQGNGPYSWQGGRIETIVIKDRYWHGLWHQSGNDREGGFELLLSEDETAATGVWWYTRVGDRNNIPPRQWGGSYVWKRTNTFPTNAAGGQ